MNIKEWLETNQIEMLTDYPYCRVVKAESVLEFFASQQAEPVARACGNEECNWSGKTERMCGEIGPLCLECGETTEPVASVQQDVETWITANKYYTIIANPEEMDGTESVSVAELREFLTAWMAGHVRVPVEPTPDMIRAGQIASRYWAASDSTENGLSPIYRAMLTASKVPQNE